MDYKNRQYGYAVIGIINVGIAIIGWYYGDIRITGFSFMIITVLLSMSYIDNKKSAKNTLMEK